MDRELYMELPPGLEFVMDVSKLARGTVCKLIRGLYGAKQSPALWNKELDTYLKSLGFEPATRVGVSESETRRLIWAGSRGNQSTGQ